VPVLGFTWYSLIDQVDWNVGLSRPLGNVNPVGLYDLNRDPRPVADSYRRLIKMFGGGPLVPGAPAATLDRLLGESDEEDQSSAAQPRAQVAAR
jgi:hypothetical protein